jgi:hypothetical protein
MNSNFNRQFILLDFQLLDDPKFIAFMNTAEFGTHMILRRYIWRGGEAKSHLLGMHELYEQKRLLVSSISREKLAEKLNLKDVTRVSKHLTKLEELGVVRRIRTGRQSIYVLGEWVDYSENKDETKRLEWFYLDQKFGPKQQKEPQKGTVPTTQSSDVAQNTTSDVAQNAHQTWPEPPHPTNNREHKYNNVRQSLEKEKDKDKVEYYAKLLAEKLGDQKSLSFYRIVCARYNPNRLLKKAAEIVSDGGARKPGAVFVHWVQSLQASGAAKT